MGQKLEVLLSIFCGTKITSEWITLLFLDLPACLGPLPPPPHHTHYSIFRSTHLHPPSLIMPYPSINMWIFSMLSLFSILKSQYPTFVTWGCRERWRGGGFKQWSSCWLKALSYRWILLILNRFHYLWWDLIIWIFVKVCKIVRNSQHDELSGYQELELNPPYCYFGLV